MSDTRSHRSRLFSALGVLPVKIAAALWAKGFFQPGYVIEIYQGGDIQMTLEAVARRPSKVPAPPSQGGKTAEKLGGKRSLCTCRSLKNQPHPEKDPASPSYTWLGTSSN
jgi:hypothetical protein